MREFPGHPSRIEVSPYRTKVRGMAARVGFLLRIHWVLSEPPGYSDLMSWPELGDLPWQEELELLKLGKPSLLGQRALELAYEDQVARTQSQSLWSKVDEPPESHFLMGSILELESSSASTELAQKIELGFKRLKIKWPAGASAERGIAAIERVGDLLFANDVRIRLDFNECPPVGGWDAWRSAWDREPARWEGLFDYWEDPAPASKPADWEQLQAYFPGLRLFVDRGVGQRELRAIADGWVVKPAWQNPLKILTSEPNSQKPIVITHALGHSLGAAYAAWYAAQCPGRVIESGLLSGDEGEAVLSPVFETKELRSGLGIGWNEPASLFWEKLA